MRCRTLRSRTGHCVTFATHRPRLHVAACLFERHLMHFIRKVCCLQLIYQPIRWKVRSFLQGKLTTAHCASTQIRFAIETHSGSLRFRLFFKTRKRTPQVTHVQGNCTEAFNPEAIDLEGFAPLGTLLPLQCLILTDLSLGAISQNTSMHNLYIRYHTTDRESGLNEVIWCYEPGCNLWLTEVRRSLTCMNMYY